MANALRAKSFRPKSSAAHPQFAKPVQSRSGGYAVEPIEGGPSWISQHKWLLIGVGGGVLVLLWLRSRSGSSGALAPAPSSGSNSYMGGAMPGGGSTITDTGAGATTNPPTPIAPTPPDWSQYTQRGSGYVQNNVNVEQSLSGQNFAHIGTPTQFQTLQAAGVNTYFEPTPGTFVQSQPGMVFGQGTEQFLQQAA